MGEGDEQWEGRREQMYAKLVNVKRRPISLAQTRLKGPESAFAIIPFRIPYPYLRIIGFRRLLFVFSKQSASRKRIPLIFLRKYFTTDRFNHELKNKNE